MIAHPWPSSLESPLSAAGGGGQGEPAADGGADPGELAPRAAEGLQLHRRGRGPHRRQTRHTQVRSPITFGPSTVGLQRRVTSRARLLQDRRRGPQTGSRGQRPVPSQPGRRHRPPGQLQQRQTDQR